MPVFVGVRRFCGCLHIISSFVNNAGGVSCETRSSFLVRKGVKNSKRGGYKVSGLLGMCRAAHRAQGRFFAFSGVFFGGFVSILSRKKQEEV